MTDMKLFVFSKEKVPNTPHNGGFNEENPNPLVVPTPIADPFHGPARSSPFTKNLGNFNETAEEGSGAVRKDDVSGTSDHNNGMSGAPHPSTSLIGLGGDPGENGVSGGIDRRAPSPRKASRKAASMMKTEEIDLGGVGRSSDDSSDFGAVADNDDDGDYM